MDFKPFFRGGTITPDGIEALRTDPSTRWLVQAPDEGRAAYRQHARFLERKLPRLRESRASPEEINAAWRNWMRNADPASGRMTATTPTYAN